MSQGLWRSQDQPPAQSRANSEVRSGWEVRMRESKLSRKERSRSQAMRCKKNILYFSKPLNQNAAKMMLEMRQGDTGSISCLILLDYFWCYSAHSNGVSEPSVPVCLHSCRYEQPTPSTYRLLERGILSSQASLKCLTVGSTSPQSHLVGYLPLLK